LGGAERETMDESYDPTVDHFDISEFTCKDGTPYPAEWEHDETRLPALKRTLERIRHANGDHAVTVLCGYRTVAYNQKLRDRGLQGERQITGVALHSQHTEGRAADIQCFGTPTKDLHDLVAALYAKGELPELGGLGYYPTLGFVHVDVYRLPSGQLRTWVG
jgi:uncharacterized protein YcbK (DUF882 family)